MHLSRMENWRWGLVSYILEKWAVRDAFVVYVDPHSTIAIPFSVLYAPLLPQ
jgi:hypothetical protein